MTPAPSPAASPVGSYPPETMAGARAASQQRERFIMDCQSESHDQWDVLERINNLEDADYDICFDGTYVECTNWIECTAFAAGLDAIPVSDEMAKKVLDDAGWAGAQEEWATQIIEFSIAYLTGRAG